MGRMCGWADDAVFISRQLTWDRRDMKGAGVIARPVLFGIVFFSPPPTNAGIR
jgi:hypothetical protein